MGTSIKLKRVGASRERDIELLEVAESRVIAKIDGDEVVASILRQPDGSAMLSVGERRYRIAGLKRRDSIAVAAGASSAEYQLVESRRGSRKGGLASLTIDAPMPGTVLKILVTEGATVNANDALIVLEAMKTETTLRADGPAVVKKIRVKAGDRVDHGATLIELGPVTEKP
jgi:biotin carboxyl carrier protein